jgi:hypothetical protein
MLFTKIPHLVQTPQFPGETSKNLVMPRNFKVQHYLALSLYSRGMEGSPSNYLVKEPGKVDLVTRFLDKSSSLASICASFRLIYVKLVLLIELEK